VLGLPLSALPWDDAVVDFGCEKDSIPFISQYCHFVLFTIAFDYTLSPKSSLLLAISY
jgi:hypothetical protein